MDLTNIKAITNDKFMPEYDNTDRYLVFYGGGDSGKSHFCATKLIARCLRAKELGYKHKFLVTRKTQPAVRKSAFALVQEKLALFPINPRYIKINKTMMEIRIFDSLIMFVGMDDPEKIKSIEGVTGIWEEEPTELRPADHTQLDLRLRGFTDSYMQIMKSFNPVDEQSWLNKEYFLPREGMVDVTPADWPKHKQRKMFETIVKGKSFKNYATCIHSTYHDNRWTTPAGIAVLEGLKTKDPNYYKVYCLGQWGVLKGLIFDNWEECSDWPKKFDISGNGLDFGYSNHPSALVWAGIIGDRLYLWEKMYETGLTNPDIADRMSDIIGDSSEVTVADCAEPKSIAELTRAGLYVLPCKKGKDSIVHGIQKMKQFKIFIHPSSIHLIKEFRAYKWAVDKDDNPINKPVDYLNHGIDGARYIVEHLTNYTKAGLEFDADPREERKAVLTADDYDPMHDDSLFEDIG